MINVLEGKVFSNFVTDGRTLKSKIWPQKEAPYHGETFCHPINLLFSDFDLLCLCVVFRNLERNLHKIQKNLKHCKILLKVR